MKTFNQFIKEANYIQERLDATVYGQLTLGATGGTATEKQIKSGVDRAIKNVGKKEGSGPIGTKGSYGIKPSGYVSLNYEKKSGGGKTPPPTKVRPDKTTDPKTPTGGRTSTQSSNGGRPNLVRSSSSSSSSTQSPSRIKNPKTAAISNMRMRSM